MFYFTILATTTHNCHLLPSAANHHPTVISPADISISFLFTYLWPLLPFSLLTQPLSPLWPYLHTLILIATVQSFRTELAPFIQNSVAVKLLLVQLSIFNSTIVLHSVRLSMFKRIVFVWRARMEFISFWTWWHELPV